MFDLQIPYWAINVCGGWLLGVATVLFLGWYGSRKKRASVLGQLEKLSIEFVSEEVDPEGDTSDDLQGN